MVDTNICIYVIKQQPIRASEFQLISGRRDLGISVITLAELEYGASKNRQPGRNRQALGEFVSALEVAAFDRHTTVAYGQY